MLSIRPIMRSAPRAITRNLTIFTRQPSTIRQLTSLQSTFSLPVRTSYSSKSSFSTSVKRSKAEGDEELAQKLESEIQAEQQMKDADGVSASVKEFLENGPFKITDTPGQEDVILTRKFGDEKIKITFSIADLNAMDPEDQFGDRALPDEDDPQASEEPLSENDAAEEEDAQSFPARLNIVIEKPSGGALAVEAIAENGDIVVDNVYFYTDAAHAHAKTAEKAHERQDLYVGPPFGNLDEDLQALLERYLDERGVNSELAEFVPDYIDMKEQKEYLGWLANVKKFVEA